MAPTMGLSPSTPLRYSPDNQLRPPEALQGAGQLHLSALPFSGSPHTRSPSSVRSAWVRIFPLLPGKLVVLHTHFIKPARCEIVKWLFRVGAVLTQHVSLVYRKPRSWPSPPCNRTGPDSAPAWDSQKILTAGNEFHRPLRQTPSPHSWDSPCPASPS